MSSAAGEGGVDEVGARAEMPVEGLAADPGGAGDVLDAGLGIGAQLRAGGGHDRGDAALGVGAAAWTGVGGGHTTSYLVQVCTGCAFR